jgi:hypothetical protein
VWSLSKKKLRPQPQSQPEPQSPQPAGFWEARGLPFLDKRALPLVVLLIAIACARIASTWTVFANVGDEPSHVACGLQYLADHVYKLETQHPPLARAVAALGPYLYGARPRGMGDHVREGMAIINYQGHPELILNLMRAGVLPFFVLACLVVFFWARRDFGGPVAVVAAGLFTLLPPVLAHAGLACTDMALAATMGAAFLTVVVWAGNPTWQNSLWLGLASAATVLSKFTSIGFLPAATGFALLFYVATEQPGLGRLAAMARQRAAMFGLAVATGTLLVWAAYWFSFGPFFDGIRAALYHNQIGHPAFLLGQFSNRGWWYYFPVALAVKTPLGFLALLAIGLYQCWRNRTRLSYLLPVAFCLGILAPAMTANVNIGVRHVLPVYLGFSIVAALAVVQMARAKWTGIAAAALVLWTVEAGAISHPDYLPYFNELVRGDPDAVLIDSDYDWGQDTKRLAHRLRELGAAEVSFGSLGAIDDQYLQVFPGLPPVKKINPIQPAEGWTAVNPTIARATQYGLNYRYRDLKPWFEYLQPKERVGTIRLYYVAPGSLRREH